MSTKGTIVDATVCAKNAHEHIHVFIECFDEGDDRYLEHWRQGEEATSCTTFCMSQTMWLAFAKAVAAWAKEHEVKL